MHLRILSVGLLGVFLSSACTDKQPRVGCVVAPGYFLGSAGDYAARYALTSGNPGDACAQKAGDTLGLAKFLQPRGGDRGTGTYGPPPDYSRANVGIKAAAFVPLQGQDPDEKLVALGELQQEVTQDFCGATSLAPAEIHAPGLDLVYTWSDLRIFQTGEIFGTQMSARLDVVENGCNARYDVWGVWPSTSCDDGAGNPDASLCAPENSGLNPDFPISCDPATLLCLLDRAPLAVD